MPMPDFKGLNLQHRLITAPMAGISDLAFRELNRSFGAELTYTEMLSAEAIFRTKSIKSCPLFNITEPNTVIQLFGATAESMVYSAQHLVDLGVRQIDINLGCPVKKVAKQGAGAALGRNLPACKEILASIRKAVSIPLSIKFRLGWSANEENYLDLAKIAEDLGIDALCLHPRYAVQGYTGKSNWEHFSRLRESSKLPIIASGDITSISDLNLGFTNYPVDYIMVGRGLIGNPWLISDFLKPNQKKHSIKAALQLHFDLLLKQYSETKSCLLFRKFISKYIKFLPNSSILRTQGNLIKNKLDFNALLNNIEDYV